MAKQQKIPKVFQDTARIPVPVGQRIKKLVSDDDLDPEILTEVFTRARRLEENEAEGKSDNCLDGRSVIFLHDQPTTRTVESYGIASKKLGATFRSVNAVDSSLTKEETLEGTVIAYAEIGHDIVIIRYSDPNALYRAAVVSPIAFINAGSGIDEHPTQRKGDTYTLFQLYGGRLSGIRLAVVGNALEGRASNSLMRGLAQYPGNYVCVTSPESLRMTGPLRYALQKKGLEIEETTDLRYALGKVDVVYLMRDQKEQSRSPDLLAELKEFRLTRRLMEEFPKLWIMHPLPHGAEFPQELENDPRFLGKKQMRNCRFTRQAWLQMLAAYGHLPKR